MLGFSSISETAIADQPGIILFIDNENLGTTSTIGTIQVQVSVTADLTGIGLSSSIADEEDISIVGTAVVSLTGISATLSLTSVIVWGKIIPAPGTSYTAITPSSSPTWTEKTTGVSQTWTEVA